MFDKDVEFTGSESGAISGAIALAIAIAERGREGSSGDKQIEDLYRGAAKLIKLTFHSKAEQEDAAEIFKGTVNHMRQHIKEALDA